MRMWPAVQPFSGEKKCISYFYFDPISQRASQRTIWIQFKIKVKYRIVTYEMENPLDSMEKKRMMATKNMRTLNKINYGAPQWAQDVHRTSPFILGVPRTSKWDLIKTSFYETSCGRPIKNVN